MLKRLRSQPLFVRGIAVFIPLLLIASGLFAWLYRAQVQAEKNKLAENETEIVTNQQLALIEEFDDVVSDLLILANQSELQQFQLTPVSTTDLSGLTEESQAQLQAELAAARQADMVQEFLSHAQYKRRYDQIRFLNTEGQEIIRINFNSGSASIVPEIELQNKSDRYYFEATIPLASEEVFMSPFDLNVEQGQVEQPFKPMIRYSTPVFNAEGQIIGIVVLNYLGDYLLNRLIRQRYSTSGDFLLLNSNGYWIKSSDPEDEWGFMFEDSQDRTFTAAYPQVWEAIAAGGEGQIETADGLFTFAQVDPLAEIQQFTNRAVTGIDDNYSWKIVSHMPSERLAVLSRQVRNRLLPLYLGVVAILALASVVILQQMRQAAQTSARIAAGMTVAEKISAGDLTVQLNINHQRDDLNRLLNAFATMTQRLSQLIGQVQQSGVQVTSSTTELASASRQLEATMTEQVASTSQIMATTQQIAATAEELFQTVNQVADQVVDTTTTASQGQTELQQMEQTIQQLAGATAGIANRLGLISERANTINTVVTTITKVADQTNLLSLNAAIEAEKAGEYGAGFSVVAREIRRLADQTAVATLEIESMVSEMQSAVSTGVMEMDKFTQEVNHSVNSIESISQQVALVIKQVGTLTPQFSAINQGTEAQAQGAQQISVAMQQLNDTSHQTAQSMQESGRAIAQLQQVVQGLQQEISRFKVNQAK